MVAREQALEGGARHIGFKDVGLPFEELRELARTIRNAGGRSYLEVVSLDEESELASARAAVELDVDCLLGGTRAAAVTEVIRDHPLRYYPFPGRITGHPSVLEGPAEEIVASARALADLEHVHGLDLLAYRFDGDVPGLMRQVAQAVTKPVIVAGHINTSLFKAKDAVRNLDNTLGIPCLFFGMEWPFSKSIWSSVPSPRTTPHRCTSPPAFAAPDRHHPHPGLTPPVHRSSTTPRTTTRGPTRRASSPNRRASSSPATLDAAGRIRTLGATRRPCHNR